MQAIFQRGRMAEALTVTKVRISPSGGVDPHHFRVFDRDDLDPRETCDECTGNRIGELVEPALQHGSGRLGMPTTGLPI